MKVSVVPAIADTTILPKATSPVDKPVFDVSRLIQAYDSIAAQYSDCARKKRKGLDCSNLQSTAIGQLQDAGVERLLTNQPDGITNEQRARLLNDYGFWLYKGGDGKLDGLEHATKILKAVTELFPDRGIAWLNLGDTVLAMVPLVTVDTEKVSLWNEARQYYARYTVLSGKKAPGADKMAVFDLPAILQSSKNVCDYVADAFNKQGMSLIASPKGSAQIGGKSVNFVVGRSDGTCWNDEIKEENCQECTDEDNDERLKGLYFPDEGKSGSHGLVIVPYHAKSYTVASDAEEVVDPNSGPVCSLDHQYHPTLVLNKSPSICQQYFEGKLRGNVKWKKIKPNAEDSTNDYPDVMDGSASVSFDGRQSVKVGHFSSDNGGGCGCSKSWIAILENGQPKDNDANQSLAGREDCNGSYQTAITINGITYVDSGVTYVDSFFQAGNDRKKHSGVLLKLDQGSFQPICSVVEIETVTPAKPKNDADEQKYGENQ